jgi:CSLREA domain-containing protein
MIRRTTLRIVVGAALFAALAIPVLASSDSSAQLRIVAPHQVESGSTAAITLKLPAGIAAVDGRIFIDTRFAELVGVSGRGATALTPQQFADGYAFGVYGLPASNAAVTISVATNADGRLPFRIVLDSAADSTGRAAPLSRTKATGAISFDTDAAAFAAPHDATRRLSTRVTTVTHDVVPDGQLRVTDLDVVRAGWESSHLNDDACTAGDLSADANGDGCVDILDVQAVLAHQSWTMVNGVATAPARLDRGASATNSAGNSAGTAAAAVTGATFVVTSASDRADANAGDGICADSQGRCTLRAAVTEANWAKGANTINFNLSGSAPVTIQMSTSLSELLLQDRTGGTLIDGYSQPGSHANNSTYGSNAIPGVYLVGTGNSPAQNGIRVTSAFNTIRGIVFNNHERAIALDGADAHDNLIAGNWLNYNRDGSPSSFKGHFNVWIANGATHNRLGSPALADRNVSGTATKAAALYGPGTDFNVFQNNLMCMTPSGTGTATCDVGTDFSFGPKHNLIGGTGVGQRNVYAASTQQCIEFAHDNGVENNDSWHNNDNSIIGNWLGFRADGSYSSSFRCGSNTPRTQSNDSNGINLADGSSNNRVEGNWIGSWYDGVNIMMGNETGNVVINNIIGVSPLGQAAPLGRYGILFRTHAVGHQITGNTIRNTASYGIAINGSDITHISLSRNVITDTSADAIHLESGANGGIQPPHINTASTAHVTGTGVAGATVEVFKASRNAGQSGLPMAYAGSAVVAGNGTWDAPVSGIASGDRVTALQTNSAGNSSALSSNASATFQPPPPAPTADFTWSQTAALTVAFTDASSGSVSQWAWEFGDGATSAQQSPSHAYAAAGAYSVKLTVSNAGGSNSKTRQVTVQAAPPPPPGAIAADAFGRTVASGWGSADTGGAYTLQGAAANYRVTGSAGTMTMAAAGSRAALLPSTSAQDVDITFRVAADKVAAGGNYVVYAVGRQNGTSEYRAKLVFNANGSVAVSASVLASGTESSLGSSVTVPGVVPAANGYVWVHARISGSNPTTITVKAWADGQPEPSAWQFSATSSQAGLQAAGGLGVRAWLSGSVTNGPVTFSFDDYAVTAP